MLALWLLLADPAHAARGFLGLEWRPLSRQDLVFVEEQRTSSTAVGEQDGTVRPNLAAFGGAWFNKYVGISAGLGVAAIVSRTATEDTTSQRHWAVLRPSLDVRLGGLEPRLRFPIPWAVVGLYGDIPTVGNRSPAFTTDEQQAADDAAYDDATRLGGVGGRVGVGVDYRLLPGLMIGAQVTVGLTGATYLGGDDRFTTLWVATEAGLLLTFEWPGKGRSSLPPEPVRVDPPQEAALPEGKVGPG